jgi:N-acetylglucosaminyldiphosphoundecaprenol N-acetyl-beta-D-mannosaminyltransferase
VSKLGAAANMKAPSKTVSILGAPISRLGMDSAVSDCLGELEAGRGGAQFFANVHTVTEASDLPALMQAFSRARRCYADGVPLLWMAKALGEPIESRVCGPDFVVAFQTALNSRKSTQPEVIQAFVGGTAGKAEALCARFAPGRGIVHSPPFRPFTEANAKEDWESVLSLASAAGAAPPRIVWVGLGAPKQELWIDHVSRLAPETLFFGVGAAFDFLTETKKRAPLWMQKSGLEWLFRLSQEPRRLFSRYLNTNSRFVLKSLRQLCKLS